MNAISPQPGSLKKSLLKKCVWPTWAQRKRTLLIEAWVFLVISYLLIAFSYLWPTDFRNMSHGYVIIAWAAYMVRVFLFHIGILTAVIAVIAGVWQRWRLLVACGPLLIMTLGPEWMPLSQRDVAVGHGDTVKVMSVNLLMVNWQCEPIIAEIRAAEPDVLLLQEYTNHWHEALQEAIGQEYPHIIYVCQEDSFGMAAYSRHRFTNQATSSLPLGSADVPQIRTVINIAEREVAVYNIHLLPPRRLDYTIEQRTQWADLLALLGNETLPTIIGGDFNFTQRCPQAAAISQMGFTDAHTAVGQWRGTTWPVNGILRYIPGLRLDHIYLGRGLIPVECHTGYGQGSDHRPVIAKAELAIQSSAVPSPVLP